MITASDAILTAFGFLGIGAAGFGANHSEPVIEADTARDTDRTASPDLLSPGEAYFEAVAAELRRTGYLDS